METVHDIKEALSAKSRTATLDELRNEGRKRVRLIRAEHVAAMVAEAVNAAVEQSGLLPPEEVERLVDKSRQEFRSILKEREQEVQRAQETEQELQELRERFEETSNALAAARQQLSELQSAAPTGVAAPGPALAGGPSADMLMAMMQEMANMKASLMTQQNGQQTAPAAAGGDLSAAIDKLAGSLNDRLEKFGRKMGISSAVESDQPIDFGGMFRDVDKTVESNMDNIKVKQKSGGGIAANLAKLKKLKGGG